jgi:hypothetical protein
MAILALAAPVTPIGSLAGSGGGPTVATPNLLPAAETSMAANVGFSFPNNGAVILRVITGSTVGVLTFIPQRTVEGNLPVGFVVSTTPGLAISSSYLWGPFSPADFNDVNGLFQATWTGFAGTASVGVYQLPTSRYGLQT